MRLLPLIGDMDDCLCPRWHPMQMRFSGQNTWEKLGIQRRSSEENRTKCANSGEVLT